MLGQSGQGKPGEDIALQFGELFQRVQLVLLRLAEEPLQRVVDIYYHTVSLSMHSRKHVPERRGIFLLTGVREITI